MNTMRLIIAAAMLCGMAMANPRVCGSITTTNDFYEKPQGTCAAWANCTAIACTSAGAASNNTAALTCLANTTLTCAALKTVTMAYFKCLRDAANMDLCQPSGNAFGELGLGLAAVVNAAEYPGSSVQQSCVYTTCQFLNLSGKGTTCATEFGAVNDSAVCMYEAATNNTNTTPTTPRPTAAPTPAPASSAASVSTAVLAVLAAAALLL
jgi:hypothetical protein